MQYFHATAGFSVKSTCIKAIKVGNFVTWSGLTYNNLAWYFSNTEKTIKGHMVQSQQGMQSTKPMTPQPMAYPSLDPDSVPDILPNERSNKLYICMEHISKLYTDNIGRFPMNSRAGNQYVMVAYHCNSNAILVCPFQI